MSLELCGIGLFRPARGTHGCNNHVERLHVGLGRFQGLSASGRVKQLPNFNSPAADEADKVANNIG